ncbi:MAG: ABC transporter ATP-binding protein [Defluviitaleaceae bacterium]|nr:ABC transporter ATP-binding protein [Defluviitaleaceae bacterium]
MANKNNVLEVKDLKKTYTIGKQSVVALQEVSFSLSKGELLVIMGRSGSGKTTLLNLLGAMDSPDKGSVSINGVHCDDFFIEPNATAYRRKQIGFVFQHYNLLKDMTAQENIALPLIMQGVPKNEIEQRVLSTMKLLGIESYQDQRPSYMSGGQQQRVAIARAIIIEPPVLLADEPTGNLDYATTLSVMEAFIDVKEKREQSCIIVTHDPKVATYADRLILLHDSKIFSEHRKEDNKLTIDFVLSQLNKVNRKE